MHRVCRYHYMWDSQWSIERSSIFCSRLRIELIPRNLSRRHQKLWHMLQHKKTLAGNLTNLESSNQEYSLLRNCRTANDGDNFYLPTVSMTPAREFDSSSSTLSIVILFPDYPPISSTNDLNLYSRDPRAVLQSSQLVWRTTCSRS